MIPEEYQIIVFSVNRNIGPWNNQVFTSSFHLVMSDFLLET